MDTTHPLALLVAFLLAVIGTARVTRLIVHDSYPPIERLRIGFLRWASRTPRRGPWSPLMTCPFCAAPYIAAVVLAAAVLADVWSPDLGTVNGWWWLLAVWASVSYLAAMLVVRDEPYDEA